MNHPKSPTWTRPDVGDRWWEPNPLAMGVYCTCGTRLERQPGQSTFYPCPFGCGDREAA